MYNQYRMTNELNVLSQSSLQDYFDCAKRFELRYIEHLSYPAVETEPTLENERHQKEGEYFHRLIQQLLIGIPIEKVGEKANTDNLQRWWQNFLTSKDLENLVKGGNGRLYPEVTLSAPLGNYRLLAKYDLLYVENEKITIYDWKTYHKRPRNEWLAARMQTRVYRALLAGTGAHLIHSQSIDPEQIEMVYWFSDFPNEPARFPYNNEVYKRDWDSLLKLADEIKSASSFPLTDDITKCSFCPYRSYCNRGIEAGTLIDSEAEMDAAELFDINFEQIGEIEF